jgi:hypothetical protein
MNSASNLQLYALCSMPHGQLTTGYLFIYFDARRVWTIAGDWSIMLAL